MVTLKNPVKVAGYNVEMEYANPYGVWKVTTEGDCEGRTVRQLGTHEGYIDEIALALADKCYYSLRFSLAKPLTETQLKTPTRKSVPVGLDIDSGTWDLTADARVTVMAEILKDRPVQVVSSTSYASVELISDAETAEERRTRVLEEVKAKLTPEELAVLLGTK